MKPDLSTALTELRLAVMAGRYDRVAELVTILEEAEATAPVRNSAELQAIRTEADRTGACLQAALSGFRTARRRIAEIADAARGLTTYDRDGTKATLTAGLPDSRRV